MKALSIRQPWAWLIVAGHKDIENRTWSTGTRGTILVHASKGLTEADYDAAKIFMASDDRLRQFIPLLPQPIELERGGIIGQVDIADCVREHASPWYTGDFGFVLRNPKPLRFRPLKGQLQFFHVPDKDIPPQSEDGLF